MFKSIGMFFSIITEVFTALQTVAKTGTKVAQVFEMEQDIAIAKRRAALAAQEELKEA